MTARTPRMAPGYDRDAVVIGGGQSGLATAQVLADHGRRPLVLEAGAEPVGSWPRYYDSLVLFSPARYSGLPGRPFPGDPTRYPRRDEVVAYLRAYAADLRADIRTGRRVRAVCPHGRGFAVEVDDGEVVTAPLVLAATGGFGNPHRPALPGLDAFSGRVLHAAGYREPSAFAGQRVVVVGAGNTAVQIAVELARHARVTLATRRRVRHVPQRPLGRDLHVWLRRTGLDALPVGHVVRRVPTVPVFDQGRYRAALDAGRPDRRPLFTGADGAALRWADGTRERVDTIILATGYRPDVGYLAPLGALDHDGHPRHDRGLSTAHPGLGYVGLEWQRSLASASLRGAGRDARHVVRRLLRAAAT